MLKSIAFLMLISITGCTHFDRQEKLLLAGQYVALSADLYQTRRLIDDPNLYETNPIIGEDKNRATQFIVSQMILTHVAAYFLPRKHRKTFLGLCCGFAAKDVYRNHRIGVR
jgi:hypothetical protein